MNNPTGLISLAISKSLESALNEAMRLDEQQGRAFEPLEDSVIALNLSDIHKTFYFLFTAYGVTVSSDLQGESSADSLIIANISSLLALPKTGQLANANISGNEIKAEQFIHALATLEIDWEEHLSHYTGDLVAFKIGHGIRSLLETKQATKVQIGDTIKEYLQFELQTVPTQSQVDHFNQQVSQLESDVDDLEARIEALLKDS
ncbi:MAG: hypothetical protein U9R28_01525 [Pseudomonadota bacterium]|nr:hypothetical protein [Pseudomonadota bacterium]